MDPDRRILCRANETAKQVQLVIGAVGEESLGVLFCLLSLFGTLGDVGPRCQQGTCDRFVSVIGDRYVSVAGRWI